MNSRGFKPLVFDSPQAWLEHYATPVPESGCWLWNGWVRSDGYGEVSTKAFDGFAHRASFTMFYGKIPAGLHICHKCDVKLCVNPRHLFVGTQADNMHDMDSKGRRKSKPLKTHCIHGHPLERPPWSARQICRVCLRITGQKYHEKNRHSPGVLK